MRRLAKLGFTQSYTYFTWRNSRDELADYLTELTQTDMREYFRPNFWPNTPDILTAYLQTGGRPAFIARLVLAATLSSNYGIYGPAFELCENVPAAPGSEEYLNSEKYEIRHWERNGDWTLRDLITRVNRIRREHPALQRNESLVFHPTDNPQLLCYSKTDAATGDQILCVVNLDPRYTQSGWTDLRMWDLDLGNEPSTSKTWSAQRTPSGAGPTTSSSSTRKSSRRTSSRSAARCAPSTTSSTSNESRHLAPGQRSALVPGRGHLPAARAVVLRRQWRRDRRLQGPGRQTRLPARPRRLGAVALAVLPVAAPRRRLRHRRLRQHQPGLRVDARLSHAPARGPPPRPAGHHRAGAQPHLRPAPVVPARAGGGAGQPLGPVLRLERDRGPLPGRAHRLPGLRDLELGLGPGRRCLLLAPLLLAPARPELRQPRGPARHDPRARLLARTGRRRDAPGRRAVSVRARGHDVRKPARDAPVPAHAARPRRRALSRAHAAGRSQPVARGRGGLFRRRRRVSHGVPLPRHAAPVHGAADGGPLPGRRHPAADAGDPGQQPVGAVPAQPRRADARDGHRRGARLHVPRVRQRPARAHQSWASGGGWRRCWATTARRSSCSTAC